MRISVLSLFMWLSFQGWSQVILFDKGIPDEHPSYFNPEFIRNNTIKAVLGEISIKREMQPITSKGVVVQYQFDRSGKLVEKLNTFKLPNGEIDTSAEAYAYNSIDEMIKKSNFERSGFSSVRYLYDSNKRVVGEEYFRGSNTTAFRYKIEKGPSTKVKTEKFEYVVMNDSSIRKIYLNTQGVPYKETSTTRNNFGSLSFEETLYLSISRGSKTRFKYDFEGRLIEINRNENLFKNREIKYVYEYDEMGNVLREKKTVNGKLVRSREFIYEVDSLLLKAELSKDEELNVITITRFRYEYHQ